jgi:hypothetical protein
MAKKATASSGTKTGGSKAKSDAKTGTSVARVSSQGEGSDSGGSGNREKFNASEALIKLLQSPLVAELVAVAATAALAALAENGFTTGGENARGKRAGKAVKAAGKAAAAAVGRRLSTEFEEIRNAASAARSGATA